jgi:hypothetical protein
LAQGRGRSTVQFKGNLDVLQANGDGTALETSRCQGHPPLFNPDQLTAIHAIVLGGAVERGEFVAQAMQIRDADI